MPTHSRPVAHLPSGRPREAVPGPAAGRSPGPARTAAGRPAEELQRLAVERGYDLLVVGTRGTGLSKVLLGSTATELAAHAKVPVLLAGGDPAA